MKTEAEALADYRAAIAQGASPEELFFQAWGKAREARRDAIKFRARLRKAEAALAEAAQSVERLAELRREVSRDRSQELANVEIEI